MLSSHQLSSQLIISIFIWSIKKDLKPLIEIGSINLWLFITFNQFLLIHFKNIFLVFCNLFLLLFLFLLFYLFLLWVYSNDTFDLYLSGNNICCNEACSIFASSFYMIFVLFRFWTILCRQCFKIWSLKRIAIVSKNKFLIMNLYSYLALSELIGDIFSILNQFPDPSYLWGLILNEVIKMLGKFLCQWHIPCSIPRLIVFSIRLHRVILIYLHIN